MKNDKFTFGKCVNYILLFGAALITLFPFYLMLITSVKTKHEFASNFWVPGLNPAWKNFSTAWSAVYLYVANSFKVTFLIVAGVTLVSILAGYAFAKMRFRFKETLYVIFLAFKMIPTSLMLIPMFINVYAMRLNDTHAGVILPTIASLSIMPVILARSFFEAIPDSIFESARIDGATENRVLWHILIPMAKSVIGTNALFTFFSAFNAYMWPLIVLSSDELKTIPIGLARLTGQYGVDYGVQMAAYTLICVPLMALIMMSMRVYVEGVTIGAVKA